MFRNFLLIVLDFHGFKSGYSRIILFISFYLREIVLFKQINQLSISESEKVKKRREKLEKELNLELKNIGCFSADPERIANRNCENMVGCAQIPIGVAGPVLVNGKGHFLPLATTEGALVASVARGAKVSREGISDKIGIQAIVENIGITRGPVFKTGGLKESFNFVSWTRQHIDEIRQVCEATSHHLKLLAIKEQVVGKNVFLRFCFDTEDAMGMNMATIATSNAVSHIEKNYKKAEMIALSGNFCVDKKASQQNFINGRGKKVWAEMIVAKNVVAEILHTTPEKIVEVVYRKCLLGSAVAGSLGYNSHYANIVAAIFLSCGQDAAHVVEGSLGITTAEVEKNGGLYFSIYMPDLICGVVGGATGLATQQEALKIMDVKNAVDFAEVIGAAVLAGELSLCASLAEGTLAKAHKKLGRGGK